MSIWEILATFLAGVAAGTINAVVGSGTLITFPTLVAFGLPPITANVSNTVGLFPGSGAAAWGYRRELAGQGRRLVRLGIAAVLGALTGAMLLLRLPASAFNMIVPVLVALGCVLVVLQPRISRWVAERRTQPAHDNGGWSTLVLVYLTGVYGGYFGAAQGVLLIAILGISLDETLQRVNAAKNVLAGLANLVAAVIFVLIAHIAWASAGLIAIGSIAGGLLGAHVGRKLPPTVLRGVIVVVGVVAIVMLLRR
ncbi:sulfite exporter TauE/SafE family protein [Actinopolymorpha alba]|uniref:sulfite exporter TauE/SafE family protein n=1 Tax=Actinopolymorpha alba TaxID=533267 RepID=UPI00036F6A47|nr:sulfite exporter TauE/SafE family protein [Actinopolymorpha alba]